MSSNKFLHPVTGKPVEGTRITELRELLNMNRTDFGEKMHYMHKHISAVEEGKYSVSEEFVKRLVQIYGVNIDWFCEDAESAGDAESAAQISPWIEERPHGGGNT